MGLLDRLTGKAAKRRIKGRRGPAKTEDEREKQRLRRFLEKHPEVEEEYFMRKAGLAAGRQSESDIAFAFIEKMQQRGIWPKNPEDMGKAENMIAEIMKALPPGVAAGVGNGIAIMMAKFAGMQPQIAESPNPQPLVTIEQPAQIETQPAPQLEQAEQKEPAMSIAASMLLFNLQSRSDPKAAAAWLLSLQRPDLQQIILVLCAQKDADLPKAVTQLGQQWSEIKPVTDWLLGRQGYLLGVVHALRAMLPKQTGGENEGPRGPGL